MLDALLENPKILRGKIIQREKFKHETSKAIPRVSFAGGSSFYNVAGALFTGYLWWKPTFRCHTLWVVPVPWNGKYSKSFWKVDSRLQWYQYYKATFYIFNSESCSIVNYGYVKLDLPLCRPFKVLHMLWFTVISYLYYKESEVI